MQLHRPPARLRFPIFGMLLLALALAWRAWQPHGRSLDARLPGRVLAQAEGSAVPPVAPAEEPPDVALDYAAVARALAEHVPATHLLRQSLDAAKSAIAWTNYLDALDYARAYFRQADIESFEPRRLTIADDLKAGDVAFAAEVFTVFRKRVAERFAHVETLLATPFDFTVEESYRWKRRDAPWPADLAAQDELWRLRVKNELLARMLDQERRAERAADAPPTAPETEPPTAPETEPEAAPEGGAIRPPAPPSNEEFVLRRHRRYHSMIADSDAEFYMTRFFGAVTMAFDPHTTYLSPASLEDFGINMQLSLQGIGAQLSTEDGMARIEQIIPGGPADRDTRDIRLVKGDRIIGVGQGDEPIVDVLHWPLYKTVRLIRGPKGTKVVLLVQPVADPSGMTTKTVDLIRDEVRLEEQAATSQIETIRDAEGRERRLGAIRLPAFYAGAPNPHDDSTSARSATLDTARLLAELNTEGVEGLVLDLRGNGGGALKEAIDLVGLFVRTGPVVLVKERTRVHTLLDRDPAVAFRKPMVVLVDRVSASASEIVAGALQDYGRAVVLGDRRSHGKGTVQQILPLGGEDGSLGAIKVTNASYFRINGSSTQVRGVESDIVLPSPFDFFAELGEDRLPNPIPWSTVAAATFRPVADLGPAIAALRGRSTERLANDARWQRHLRRLQRIQHVNELEKVPLHIDRRREFAAAERELDELDQTLEDDEGTTRQEREAARRAQDVVLDEALRLLADLIDVHGPLTSLQGPQDAPGRDSLFERFFR